MSSTGATGTGATGTGATGTDGATLSTATVAGGTVSNTTGGGPTCDETSLREAARCVNRPIGVALTTRHLGEAAYAEAAREFDYVTPEDEMKWDATEPSQGQFTYGAADQIVNFALENAMKVKGHTLVWHRQLPGWVTSLTSADAVRAAMLNHIQNLVEYYRGKVIAWDAPTW